MTERKSAFVTGGAGDLGLASARRLAAGGYEVALFDTNAETVAQAARQIGGAVGFAGDVSDEASVEKALDQFGKVPDVLVNCAGIVRFRPLLECSAHEFRKVLDVNLVGAFIVAKAVARRMAARKSGVIVNITSLNGVVPGPNSGAYPAAKAGLAKLTELMALEWGALGIRVNAVAPGFIDAGISKPVYAVPKTRALRSKAVPCGRLGHEADVAEAVFYLASDASSYVNGHELVVDGGVSFSVLAQLPRGD